MLEVASLNPTETRLQAGCKEGVRLSSVGASCLRAFRPSLCVPSYSERLSWNTPPQLRGCADVEAARPPQQQPQRHERVDSRPTIHCQSAVSWTRHHAIRAQTEPPCMHRWQHAGVSTARCQHVLSQADAASFKSVPRPNSKHQCDSRCSMWSRQLTTIWHATKSDKVHVDPRTHVLPLVRTLLMSSFLKFGRACTATTTTAQGVQQSDAVCGSHTECIRQL